MIKVVVETMPVWQQISIGVTVSLIALWVSKRVKGGHDKRGD